MTSLPLIQNRWKPIGWVIFIFSGILGIYLAVTNFDSLPINTSVFTIYGSGDLLGDNKSFGFIRTNITNTLVGSLFIIGGIIVGFSKEKNEDEFISNLRLSSLLWAVFVNYILLLLALIFIYGPAFLNIMLYNMFTVLILFILRFNYLLYRNNHNTAK